MRSRVVGAVLIAGLVAFAGPGWSQSRSGGHGGGGGHSGGSVRSGGGGHNGSRAHGGGGHSGAGAPRAHVGRDGQGGHPHGNPHPGFHHPYGGHYGGGHYGWHGSFGWGGFYLSFPLWWDAYWSWGWPYWGGRYGYWGYFGDPWFYDYYGSPAGYGESSIFNVPTDSAGGGGAGEPSPEVSGPSPVNIEVSPNSALVYLNGVLIGSVDEFDGTPDVLYLSAGQYTVDFRLPGFRSRSVRLDINGESKVLLSLDLQVDPAGKAEQATPPSPGLPFGRTFDPSFGPAASQARLTEGDTDEDQPGVASAAAFTALELRVSPPGAAVYLDGVLIGTGDNLARLQQGLVVSPGPHRIDVVAPGRTGKTLQVNAVAGKKVEMAIALQ